MSRYLNTLTARMFPDSALNSKISCRISSRNEIFVELIKAHQNDYHASRSRLLATAIKRYCPDFKNRFIYSKPKYVRKSAVFVAEIKRKLLCLHKYNLKVAKFQGNKYPKSWQLEDLLILYVELECEHLYNTSELVTDKKEFEVKQRVFKVLHFILHDAIHKNDVPLYTTWEICLKLILRWLVNVRRDIFEQNNVIDNAIVKIVENLGHLDEVNKFKEKNPSIYLDSFLQEPEALELLRKLTTSVIFDSDEDDDEDDSTQSSDDRDDDGPKYAKHLPLILVKEEKEPCNLPSDSEHSDYSEGGDDVRILESGAKESVGKIAPKTNGEIVIIEILDDDDDDIAINNVTDVGGLPALDGIKVENDENNSPKSVFDQNGDGGDFGPRKGLDNANSLDPSTYFTKKNGSVDNRDELEEVREDIACPSSETEEPPNDDVISDKITETESDTMNATEVNPDPILETLPATNLVLSGDQHFENVSEDEAQEEQDDQGTVHGEDNLQVQDMDLEETPQTAEVIETNPQKGQSLEEIIKDLETNLGLKEIEKSLEKTSEIPTEKDEVIPEIVPNSEEIDTVMHNNSEDIPENTNGIEARTESQELSTVEIQEESPTETPSTEKCENEEMEKVPIKLSIDEKKEEVNSLPEPEPSVDKIEETGKSREDEINETEKTEEDIIKETGKTETDMIEETGKTEKDMIEETGKTEKDMIDESGKTEKDMMEETGKTEKDMIEESGKTEKDMIEETGKTEKDMIEETGKTKKDMIEESGKIEKDMIEETGKTEKDMIEETGKTDGDLMEEIGKTSEELEVEDSQLPTEVHTTSETPINSPQEIKDSPLTTDSLYYDGGVTSTTDGVALVVLAEVASKSQTLDVKNDAKVSYPQEMYAADGNTTEDDNRRLVIDETPRTRKSKVRMGNKRQTRVSQRLNSISKRLTRNSANKKRLSEMYDRDVEEPISPTKVTDTDFIALQNSSLPTPTNNVYAQKRVSEANPISEDSNDSGENSLVIDEGCGKTTSIYDEDTIDDGLKFICDDVTCISIPEPETPCDSAPRFRNFHNFHILEQMEKFVGNQPGDEVLNLSANQKEEPEVDNSKNDVQVKVSTPKPTNHMIENILNTPTSTVSYEPKNSFAENIRSNFETIIQNINKLKTSLNAEEGTPIDLTLKKVNSATSIQEVPEPKTDRIESCGSKSDGDLSDPVVENEEPTFKSKGALKSFERNSHEKAVEELSAPIECIEENVRTVIEVEASSTSSEPIIPVEVPMEMTTEEDTSVETVVPTSLQIENNEENLKLVTEVPSASPDAAISEGNPSVPVKVTTEDTPPVEVIVLNAPVENKESERIEADVRLDETVELETCIDWSGNDSLELLTEEAVVEIQTNEDLIEPAEVITMVTESVSRQHQINLDLPPVLIQQEPRPEPKTPTTADLDQPPRLECQIEPKVSLPPERVNKVSAHISSYPLNSMPSIISTSPIEEQTTTKSRNVSDKNAKACLENTIQRVKKSVREETKSPLREEISKVGEKKEKDDGRQSRSDSYSGSKSKSDRREHQKSSRRSVSKSRSQEKERCKKKKDEESDRGKRSSSSNSHHKKVSSRTGHSRSRSKSKTVETNSGKHENSQDQRTHSRSSDKLEDVDSCKSPKKSPEIKESSKSRSFEREKSSSNKSSSNKSDKSKSDSKSYHEAKKEVAVISKSSKSNKEEKPDVKDHSDSKTNKDVKTKDIKVSIIPPKDEKKSEAITKPKDAKVDKNTHRKKDGKLTASKPKEIVKDDQIFEKYQVPDVVKSPKQDKSSKKRPQESDHHGSSSEKRKESKISPVIADECKIEVAVIIPEQPDAGKSSSVVMESQAAEEFINHVGLEEPESHATDLSSDQGCDNKLRLNETKSKQKRKPKETAKDDQIFEKNQVLDVAKSPKQDISSKKHPQESDHHGSSSKRRKESKISPVIIADERKIEVAVIIPEQPDTEKSSSVVVETQAAEEFMSHVDLEVPESHATDLSSDQGYDNKLRLNETKSKQKGKPKETVEDDQIFGKNQVLGVAKSPKQDISSKKHPHESDHHCSSNKRRKESKISPVIADESQIEVAVIIPEQPDAGKSSSVVMETQTAEEFMNHVDLEEPESHAADLCSDQGYESVASQSINNPASVGSHHKTPTEDDGIAMGSETEVYNCQRDFGATTLDQSANILTSISETSTKMFIQNQHEGYMTTDQYITKGVSICVETVDIVTTPCSTVIRQNKTCLGFPFSGDGDNNRGGSPELYIPNAKENSCGGTPLTEIKVLAQKESSGDHNWGGPLLSGSQEDKNVPLLSGNNNFMTIGQFEDDLPSSETITIDDSSDLYLYMGNQSGTNTQIIDSAYANKLSESQSDDYEELPPLDDLIKNLNAMTGSGPSAANDSPSKTVEHDDSIKSDRSEDALANENIHDYAVTSLLSLNESNTSKSESKDVISPPAPPIMPSTTTVTSTTLNTSTPLGNNFVSSNDDNVLQKVLVESVAQCPITSEEERKSLDTAPPTETVTGKKCESEKSTFVENSKKNSTVPHPDPEEVDMSKLFKRKNNRQRIEAPPAKKVTQQKSTRSPQSLKPTETNNEVQPRNNCIRSRTNNNESKDMNDLLFVADLTEKSRTRSDNNIGQSKSPVAATISDDRKRKSIDVHISRIKKRRDSDFDDVGNKPPAPPPLDDGKLSVFDKLKNEPPVNPHFINNTLKASAGVDPPSQQIVKDVKDRTSAGVQTAAGFPQKGAKSAGGMEKKRDHPYRNHRESRYAVNGVGVPRGHSRPHHSGSYSGYVTPDARRPSAADVAAITLGRSRTIPNPKLSTAAQDDHSWLSNLDGVIDNPKNLFDYSNRKKKPGNFPT